MENDLASELIPPKPWFIARCLYCQDLIAFTKDIFGNAVAWQSSDKGKTWSQAQLYVEPESSDE